mgnify:CR=1 FL=1
MDGAPGLHGTFMHPESSFPFSSSAQWRMSLDAASSIGSTYTYESESSLMVTNSYAHRSHVLTPGQKIGKRFSLYANCFGNFVKGDHASRLKSLVKFDFKRFTDGI